MGANNDSVNQETNSQEHEETLEAQQHEEQQDTAQADSADVVEPQEEATEASSDDASSDDADSPEVAELRKQVEEHQQRLLRVQADYDNFRRRTRLEKEDYLKYASADLIEKLLPVLDNFDRALAAGQNGNDHDALFKGIDMIYRQFQGVLEDAGLSAMDAKGQAFNPEFHEAVMKEESDEHEEGIVLEELQKGYMFKDKVLRPAMVKVSG